MKKNTKSLWIYAAILLTIAIALICITTFGQAKLVEHDGNFEVLGTLMQTSEQNISRLTQENINLSNQCAELSTKNDELKEEIAGLQSAAKSAEDMRKLSADIFAAYAAKDTEKLAALMENVIQEKLDAFIPGLYTAATTLLQPATNRTTR